MREFAYETDMALEAAEMDQPALVERREQAIGRLLAEYSGILRDGRYDMAFNRLSKYLYHLRSLQFEIERDKGEEAQWS